MMKRVGFCALLCIALVMVGCDSGTPPVTYLRTAKLVASDSLNDIYVDVKVNGGVPQRFRDTNGDDIWVLSLIGVNLNQNNDIDVTWYVDVAGQSYTVATASETFFADTSVASVNVSPDYLTSAYNHDNDDRSNMQEIEAGTFPVSIPEMVSLEDPGSFTMGSPLTELGCVDDAGVPVHCFNEVQTTVALGSFAISKYELTFDQYLEFVNMTGRVVPDDEGWGRGSRPVINVSFEDATAYAQWLSQQTGKSFRLPTEAEWEYAARAGSVTAYSTGETLLPSQANFASTSTVSVDSFAPNAFGLHNMHGNVVEWTCSLYQSAYTGAESRCVTVAQGLLVSARGGAWALGSVDSRSANRGWVNPVDGVQNTGNRTVGIRIARDL